MSSMTPALGISIAGKLGKIRKVPGRISGRDPAYRITSDVGTSATRSRKTVGAKRAEGRNPTRLLDKQSEERLKHRYHKAGAEHGRAEIRQFEQGFPLFVVEQSNNLAHDRSPLAR
jgi:hypothetical protein